MLLRCVRSFGNFVPGDEVEAPDGAVFDHVYFEQAAEPKPEAKEGK
jgi:hypothetical protein